MQKSKEMKREELDLSQPNQDIHCKVMLCIRCKHKGVVCHELTESGERITGDAYRRQLMRLKCAI